MSYEHYPEKLILARKEVELNYIRDFWKDTLQLVKEEKERFQDDTAEMHVSIALSAFAGVTQEWLHVQRRRQART